ncbi:alpha/beta hydrolase [Candidatus Daviesbacteria bacterium]|nr:alpha/beta hydrolase [Candidatus Daviesbacteria bacterium]
MQRKETIVLLHGWGGSKKSLAALADELKKSFNVLNLELPGFGDTQEPKFVWGIKDYAKYVVEQAQKQGAYNFHLFGHSFGGQVAAQVALSDPDKLKKLILCGAAVVRKKSGLIKLKIKTAKLLKNTPFPLILSFLMRRSDYQKASPQMKKIMNKVLQEDLTQKLTQIKSPTLILWGEKDSYTSLPQAYLIHQKIPNSKLKIFKDLRHNLPLVKAKLVAEEIKKWI